MESQDERTAEQLILDYRRAELSPADRALCDFAVRLTLTPGAMREDDVAGLRSLEFDDATILIAVQVIGYFNYINRVADALHVDLETSMTRSRDEWLAAKAHDWADDLERSG